jgi:hypothetical protein
MTSDRVTRQAVMANKFWVPALLLSLLCVPELPAQSGGRDLPDGFRSVAGVTLNRDDAATVRSKLGNTRERQIGTGHDLYISWCYVSAEAPRVLLELMSDASDMGTPSRALNVIRLRTGTHAADRDGCASLPASATLSTPAGLHLGQPVTQIEKLLGAPSRRAADSVIYYFDAKEDLRIDSPEFKIWNTPEHRETCFDAGLPYANVAATVIVLLRDGRVTELRIERNDQSIC